MSEYKRPPIGIKPKWVWEHQRFNDLNAAINRYLKAGLPVKLEWVEEYNELHKKLLDREAGNK